MRLFEGTVFDRPPHCEKCGRLETECACPPPAVVEIAPEKQTVRLQVENRKRGKQVVAIRGVKLSEAGLDALLTKLKNSCGAGGSIDDGVIEIQGGQVERVRAAMEKLGYRVK
ncbi:translation initiation factor Sui1 [Caulifigura coniformis]|uniref:Translation initiation factor Sui1 n=1 Tax=Caulifigura coniformis TaxID=2527983 RepID=A0A517SBH9_9PLAN|nr:translation initiation factor [Caulifigura coniformis]QDT53446.1 translation initiation factor Sui1 [Caulifigura coniformis]